MTWDLPSFAPVVVLGASLIAAFTDVWRFKVYNVLTLPLLLSAFVYRGVEGGGDQIVEGLYGMLFGLGLLLFPYMLGAMGAGDVKFVAAIGAWLGVKLLVPSLVIGSMAAGLYAVVLMVMHNGYRRTWMNMQLAVMRLVVLGRQLGAEDDFETMDETLDSKARRQRLIPFSAMVTVGVIATYVLLIRRVS